MARGWESKSVEAQQEEATRPSGAAKPRLTREEADRRRELESLRLSLNRIAAQLESSKNGQHRQMLEQAKADLESRMDQYGTQKAEPSDQ